jgi:Zn-dependent peptidase ImmA (M78 family)/transcriptional regulator with XRE-family HTH domain
MRHANPAMVAPSVLNWALERATVSTSDLASAVGTSAAVVEEWLGGHRQPSFRQARAAATRLRIPLGFLFLAEPPPDDLPIPDFRTVDGHRLRTISVDLRDVLLATMRKQEWLSEERRDGGADPVAVVGRAEGATSSSAVATDIRRTLRLPTGHQRPVGADHFMRDIVQRVEGIGVSVLRSGVVGNNTSRPLKIEEFRGFALSDDYAPFIFINTVDARHAQIFTLIHELTHIWRGDSGISGGVEQASLSVETFSNRVAADVLVPPDEFRSEWLERIPPRDAIRTASRHFRISRYVIAIRAFESGFISRDVLDDLFAEYRPEGSRPGGATGGGGDYYKTLIARNGRSFTEGVVDAVGRQRVLVRDAAGLLDAKPGQLPRISREIRGAG